MRKRPLCFLCLVYVTAVFLCLQLRGAPPPSLEDWEGQQKKAVGQVYQKEIRSSEQGLQTLIYIKLTDSFLDPVSKSEISNQELINKNSSYISQIKSYKNIICYLNKDQQIPAMGSSIYLSGTLRSFERATNPGQFDQQKYYQKQYVLCKLINCRILNTSLNYSRWREALYQLKIRCSECLDACFPEVEASVLKTMLLGEKGQLNAEMKSLYQRNGIAHILAISGLHLSLLGMGLYHLLRRIYLPVPCSAVLSMLVMYLYGTMVGMGTSCIRALVMFLLHMMAVLCGRTYDLLTALCVAAVGILMEQPLYLQDSGFQFSFGAVLAIALLLPTLQFPVTSGKKKDVILWQILSRTGKTFCASLSVSLVTLPVLLSSYYQFPLYSLLLNLLVIPLMRIVMGGGIAVLLLGSFSLNLGKWVGLTDTLILFLYERAGGFFEQLPFHNLILGKPKNWQIVVYLCMLIFLLAAYRKLPIIVRYFVLIVAVGILIFPTYKGVSITFLDVGQGDCIHIRSETGKHYLVDGGSSSAFQVGKYRISPYLKSQGAAVLEAIFVTHPDEDHISGVLELFEMLDTDGVRIRRLVLPDISRSSRSEAYQQLVELAESHQIQVIFLSAGEVIEDGGPTLSCLHPYDQMETADANAYSLVLLVQYEAFHVLLTGDLEGIGEEKLIRDLQKQPLSTLNVLKVAHHGSKNSTTGQFLALTNPEIAIISCGKGNTYGHPHKELVDRLEKAGCLSYRTDETGAITIEVRRDKWRVTTFMNLE